jgi:hypothetical protein
MTATVGSQLFGPWYDILGYVLTSGMFFYLAFATPTLALSVKNRIPAFLSKRFCLVLGFGAAGMAVFHAANMHSSEDGLPEASMAALSAGPAWKAIYTGTEGETLSINPQTIVRNGSTVSYSEQVVFRTPKPFPMPLGMVVSMTARLLINCMDRTQVRQELVIVRSDGSTIFQDNSEAPPVVPLSTGPTQMDNFSPRYMCELPH